MRQADGRERAITHCGQIYGQIWKEKRSVSLPPAPSVGECKRAFRLECVSVLFWVPPGFAAAQHRVYYFSVPPYTQKKVVACEKLGGALRSWSGTPTHTSVRVVVLLCLILQYSPVFPKTTSEVVVAQYLTRLFYCWRGPLYLLRENIFGGTDFPHLFIFFS